MGFFSYKCRGCDHPLLSNYALSRSGINEWMQNAVVIHKDYGVVAAGFYDGYGRIPATDDVQLARKGGAPMYELTYDEESGDCMEAVWHNACYKKAGEPAFDKPSESASDQGYFFKPGDHDMLNPLEAN